MHPSQSKARIKPGIMIVLEGLDAAGKSTQARRFELGQQRGMFDHDLLVTHQPSGGSPVGTIVYSVIEQAEIASPWSRQFLHLAAHAEQYQLEILPALNHGVPVIMDRCWWSTVAYGFDACHEVYNIDYESFINLVQIPTQGHKPDVVFLFDQPHAEDPHNTEAVEFGYLRLANRYREEHPVVRVEPGTEEAQFYQILTTLVDLGLAS